MSLEQPFLTILKEPMWFFLSCICLIFPRAIYHYPRFNIYWIHLLSFSPQEWGVGQGMWWILSTYLLTPINILKPFMLVVVFPSLALKQEQFRSLILQWIRCFFSCFIRNPLRKKRKKNPFHLWIKNLKWSTWKCKKLIFHVSGIYILKSRSSLDPGRGGHWKST